MRSVYLDLAEISTPEELHQELKRALRLPTWYGGNLDALYDCLTSLSKPICLELDGLEGLANLGKYSTDFMNTLLDAAEANPNFTVEM